MFRHYVIMACRGLLRHKAYSFINIVGLAIGMASCLLIFLYIRDELSFDRQHENAASIYRVAAERGLPGNGVASALTPRSLAGALEEAYPEILRATRLSREHAERVLVSRGETRYYEGGVVFADPDVFEVFTLPLAAGDARSALAAPYSIVITEEMARKYFGNADPLGRQLTLRLLGDNDRFDYTVTAIARNPPANSHFAFDFLAAYRLHPFTTTNERERESFGNPDLYTYLLLAPGTNPGSLEAKLPEWVRTHPAQSLAAAAGNGVRYFLQPLTAIHLHSALQDEFSPTGDMSNVILFAAIALFILILACINFANLATARSAVRAREIGVRKTFGSRRLQLVRQFLGESTLLSFFALVLALGVVELLLPAFNALSGKTLEFSHLHGWTSLPVLAALALCVGVLAGLYPALFLSGLRPVVLAREFAGTTRRAHLRGALVAFQFAVSMALMAGTIVIVDQVRYVAGKWLGFESEHLLVLEGTEAVRRQSEVFRQALLRVPGVVAAAHAESMPGRPVERAMIRLEDAPGGAEMARMFVGFDFVETLGMNVAEGRSLSRANPADAMGALLNQEAVAALGLEDAVGRRVSWGSRTYTVVGVVEDFHFASLHQSIGPLLLAGPDPEFENRPVQLFAVRLRGSDLQAALDALRATWEAFVPEQPFAYSFLDADLGAQYRGDRRTAALFGVFAALAIFIACLGLFGLAAFTAQRRTREIGIRKALGASILGIVNLLSRDFLKPVVLGFMAAMPLAYLGMRRWLDTFAYRIELGWEPFALAGLLALCIAMATVSSQSLKAALAHPVEALRHE